MWYFKKDAHRNQTNNTNALGSVAGSEGRKMKAIDVGKGWTGRYLLRRGHSEISKYST